MTFNGINPIFFALGAFAAQRAGVPNQQAILLALVGSMFRSPMGLVLTLALARAQTPALASAGPSLVPPKK